MVLTVSGCGANISACFEVPYDAKKVELEFSSELINGETAVFLFEGTLEDVYGNPVSERISLGESGKTKNEVTFTNKGVLKFTVPENASSVEIEVKDNPFESDKLIIVYK